MEATTPWTTLPFGKYRNLSCPQVVLSDPAWFFQTAANGTFEKFGEVASEASIVQHRARRIRIPKPDPENWRVEYLVGYDRSFHRFDIVPKEQQLHEGGSTAVRSAYLNLAYPREWKARDKDGFYCILSDFKAHWFGDREAQLTKAQCEDFFRDPANFMV